MVVEDFFDFFFGSWLAHPFECLLHVFWVDGAVFVAVKFVKHPPEVLDDQVILRVDGGCYKLGIVDRVLGPHVRLLDNVFEIFSR